MTSNNRPYLLKPIHSLLSVFFCVLAFHSCKHDHRLDKIIIHQNPFIKITSRPEILLDNLNNPSALFFNGNRILFAESGKGIIYEYKDKKVKQLIEGFKLDSYERYSLSVLGITAVPGKNMLIVSASQDSGHIFLFDESVFPVTADQGREIELQRTESSNPFGVLLAKKGTILVATGGTKSVYQGNFDAVNPNPLKPVFDVKTGVAGLAEDTRSGDIFGAVIGTGQNDGYIIRWNPSADTIQPTTLTKGFSNLVGVLIMPNGLLLVLEFGSFETRETGRVSLIDPENPGKSYPLISGLDSPSGFTLGSDNTLLISVFGKKQSVPDGMLISLKLN